MKRILILFVLSVLVGGCATVESITAPNRTHLLKLSIGMNKDDALEIMGHKTMVVKIDAFHSVVINNPYRFEILQGKDKTYEVFYFVTDNKFDDNVIRDDDLTPLVFDDGQLMGWGQNFLKGFMAKNEIKTSEKEKSKSKSKGMGFDKKKK